jgi:ABC-type lipoprotein release transport system permease subunit
LQPILFHTNVLEPLTVAVVLVLGGCIAIAAAAMPMRTVIRTDVMEVLREQ